MRKQANITLSVIIAAILTAGLGLLLPKDAEKYLGERFWSQKTFAPSRYDVVLMGDSRVYRGLSPRVMQSVLPGFSILNFGYSNGGLNRRMFKAAEEKLDDRARQKIIVMGISANTITRYSVANDQYLQELTRPREEIIERLYLNPVKYWFTPTSPEQLIDLLNESPDASYYRNKYFSNGYVRSEKFPVDTTEALPSYVKDYKKYKVDSVLMDDLFAQLEEWKQEGIMVFGFRPPVTVSMGALADTLGGYNETIIRNRFTAAGGFWIDMEGRRFSTYDGSHLDPPSAEKLSKIVAEEISVKLKQLNDDVSE